MIAEICANLVQGTLNLCSISDNNQIKVLKCTDNLTKNVSPKNIWMPINLQTSVFQTFYRNINNGSDVSDKKKVGEVFR